VASQDADQARRASGASGLTPSTARRKLGEELRAVREATGLILGEAAARIQRSAATLSRLETGKSVPRLVDVLALLDQYAEERANAVSNGTRELIIELAEQGRAEEWFAPFRDVISGDMTPDDVQRYVEFESDATTIWSYEPELVPGLLQTQSYAEGVARLFFPKRSDVEIARFVEFRIARQHVLRRKPTPLRFDVVIGESALRRVIGGAEVMREQLLAVLSNITNGQSNVRIRIAPITLAAPAVVGGPWVVMDFAPGDEPGLVHLESRGGSGYFRNAEMLDRYRQFVVGLDAAVADQEYSQHVVQEALGDLD
jgi:transcriptional regulator with XRE-family HTH domain